MDTQPERLLQTEPAEENRMPSTTRRSQGPCRVQLGDPRGGVKTIPVRARQEMEIRGHPCSSVVPNLHPFLKGLMCARCAARASSYLHALHGFMVKMKWLIPPRKPHCCLRETSNMASRKNNRPTTNPKTN
jgi:hypothetical protein